MPKYEVVGEYGPIAGMSISLEIEEPTASKAFDTFCMLMEADYPSEWARMGRNNVAVIREIKPKEIVVSKWWVKYKHGLGFHVTAATFFEAVAAAEKHVADNNLDRDSVLSVAYMAY